MKYSECLRALKSHMTKWEKGEIYDDELTDCRHLAMVAWNAIALLVYEIRGIGENNIPGQVQKKVDDVVYFQDKLDNAVGVNNVARKRIVEEIS